MKLTVTGNEAPIKEFKHLWGYYVTGFKPWTHCARCFEHKIASAIHPKMQDGTYPLRHDLDFFYLCGVGQPDSKRLGEQWNRKFTNVHLAVTPRKGSVAAIGSVYGVTFVIEDAQAIQIQTLPQGFMGIQDPKHTSCKNFQFGYQIFEASEVGPQVPKHAIRTVRPKVLHELSLPKLDA